MKPNIFLNSKLKARYLNDFNQLLQSDLPFWKIDNQFIMEKLISINSNKNIQTLYSKFGKECHEETYLTFTFTSKVEKDIIRRIIPDILYTFNNCFGTEDSICYYNYLEPHKNLNCHVRDVKVGMGCRDDEDYFMVNHIQITQKSYSCKKKEEFWKLLEKLFKELK